MLKILALLFAFQSSAWADSQPCEVQDTQTQSEIACDDVRISHSTKDAKIEFVDGFTLFFHLGNQSGEERMRIQVGERQNPQITSKDQRVISRLVKLMGHQLTELENDIIALFQSVPTDEPLVSDDSNTGGEVPWPIPGDEDKPATNPQKPK